MARDNIQFNVRYNFGFNNVFNEELRDDIEGIPQTNELLYDYNYIENDFSISNFSILFSYNREFYIHKKKK